MLCLLEHEGDGVGVKLCDDCALHVVVCALFCVQSHCRAQCEALSLDPLADFLLDVRKESVGVVDNARQYARGRGSFLVLSAQGTGELARGDEG